MRILVGFALKMSKFMGEKVIFKVNSAVVMDDKTKKWLLAGSAVVILGAALLLCGHFKEKKKPKTESKPLTPPDETKKSG